MHTCMHSHTHMHIKLIFQKCKTVVPCTLRVRYERHQGMLERIHTLKSQKIYFKFSPLLSECRAKLISLSISISCFYKKDNEPLHSRLVKIRSRGYVRILSQSLTITKCLINASWGLVGLLCVCFTLL